MYTVELEPEARVQTLLLSYEATRDFGNTLVALEVDPWNFRRSPTEPVGSHYAHRTVPFADGLGLVTFLILEHASEVHVTRIVWLGREYTER